MTARPKEYLWKTLTAEAKRDAPKVPPFVLGGIVPKITIKAPTGKTKLELLKLVNSQGNTRVADLDQAFKLIAGDAYPALWARLDTAEFEEIVAVFQAIFQHFFQRDADATAEAVPGGDSAS